MLENAQKIHDQSKALSKSPDPAWPELRQCSTMPLPCATAAGRVTIQTCRGVDWVTSKSQGNHHSMKIVEMCLH